MTCIVIFFCYYDSAKSEQMFGFIKIKFDLKRRYHKSFSNDFLFFEHLRVCSDFSKILKGAVLWRVLKKLFFTLTRN